jgi:DNA-binding GntR family transcriptional regulator
VKTAVRSSAPRKKRLSPNGESAMARIYNELRSMAMSFEFRPGERLNEVVLAKRLGVSRTPLREALNRLTAEGFLSFAVNQGFFRKPLEVKEIFDLFEFRQQVEIAVVKLALERATNDQFAEIECFLKDSMQEVPERTSRELVGLDEEFHERLTLLTGNREMLNCLKNINGRIQYVRWVNMDGRRSETQGQHMEIIQRLRARDLDGSVQLMKDHIAQRMDQIIEKVERCYGRIYIPKQYSDLR